MRSLLFFLLGVLVGANAVYWAASRGLLLPARTAPTPAAVPRSVPTLPPAQPPATRPPGAPPSAAPAPTPAAPMPAAPVPAAPVPAPSAPARDGLPALAMPLASVAPSQLVDSFHDLRDGSRPHEALDIPAPAGTPVLAVADGQVAKLFTSDAGGLTVYQFDPTQRYAYYYAHLQGYAAGLAEGQAVRRGQRLGYVGSTGNASPEAPHLHFAVFVLGPEKRWWQGTAIDPYPLLGGAPR